MDFVILLEDSLFDATTIDKNAIQALLVVNNIALIVFDNEGVGTGNTWVKQLDGTGDIAADGVGIVQLVLCPYIVAFYDLEYWHMSSVSGEFDDRL